MYERCRFTDMEYTLKEIWEAFRWHEKSVDLDTDEYEASVYKGVKMVNDGERIYILSTASDIYKEVDDDIYYAFITEGVENGVKAFQKKRYERQLLSNMHSQKSRETIQSKIDRL